MSLYDYQKSKEIDTKDYPFYSIIMAAIRKADAINLVKFITCWPGIVEELNERYNNPGGKLDGE